jgi:hypothetical protein
MENKTIQTTSGKTVVLKQLLTGRDIEYIEQPMLDLKIAFSEKGKLAGEMNAGDAKTQSLHRAIEKVVISVDGKTDSILEIVLDLPAKDYREIALEVDKIVAGDSF